MTSASPPPKDEMLRLLLALKQVRLLEEGLKDAKALVWGSSLCVLAALTWIILDGVLFPWEITTQLPDVVQLLISGVTYVCWIALPLLPIGIGRGLYLMRRQKRYLRDHYALLRKYNRA